LVTLAPDEIGILDELQSTTRIIRIKDRGVRQG
jgi:hypothetical protein